MKRFIPLAIAVLAVSIPARAEEIFVTNERDNTLSVIDGDSFEVVRTIPVGRRPRGVTFAKDPDTGQVRHDLPSGEDPEQFALAPDGRTLFIANEENATTTVVDAQTRKVLAQIDVGIEPEGMAVSPDGRIAVTTSETTNMVHWIDTKTLQAVDATPVGQRPRFAAFSADGTRLWASSEIGGTVSVIDVASRTVVDTVSFAVKGVASDRIQPVGIQFSKDGRHAFVALGPSDRVAVVDTATHRVESYILVGRRVWQLALNAAGTRLFTTNGASGDVTVIDAETFKPIRTVKVGRFPWGVAARPMPDAAPPDGRAAGATP